MNSITKNQNSPRLLDQLRTAIRYKHYSYATEKAYVYSVRFYIRFDNLQHPAQVSRPATSKRLPVVLTRQEVTSAFDNLEGVHLPR